MSQKPKVKIHSMDLIENEYNDNFHIYNTLKLIEHSKKYKSFDLPLAGLDISRMPWGKPSINQLAHHIIRMKKASLKHPILLDQEGYICDGWHRVLKALVLGRRTIKAIRLNDMPEPDRVVKSKK